MPNLCGKNLDEKSLRKLAKGRSFVIDNENRCPFVDDSQVLDYASQLASIVSEFERGTHHTFAVSPDFYSNNLNFKYAPQVKQLEVYEINGGNFRLQVTLKSFKEALKKAAGNY